MYPDNSPLAPIFSRLAPKLNCHFKVKLFFRSCLVSQLKPFLTLYVAFVIDKHLDGKGRESQFPSFAEDTFTCRFTSSLFYEPFLKEVFFSFFKHRSQNAAVYINNYHEQAKNYLLS